MKQIAFTGIIETGNNSDMFYMSLRLIFCPFSMFKKLARQLGCCVLVVFTNIKTYVTTGSQNPSLTQLRNKTNAKQMQALSENIGEVLLLAATHNMSHSKQRETFITKRLS